MSILYDICKGENIAVKSLEDVAKIGIPLPDAPAVALGGKYRIVLLKDGLEKWERRHLAAHEIGHHLMGHLTPNFNCGHETMELEANVFSAVMTALMVFHEYYDASPKQNAGAMEVVRESAK